MEYAEYDLDELMHTLTGRQDIQGRMARECTVADWQVLRGIVAATVIPGTHVAEIAAYWARLPTVLRSPVALSMLSLVVMEIAELTDTRSLPLIERLYAAYEMAR